MRRILAIDTAGDIGSLALMEDGELREEVVLKSDDGFAHFLFSQIEVLLKRHDWSLGSIDCFAAAAGPGSFTGVRVGLTAAKGFAETLGKPAAGFSNLAAIASFGSASLRAPVFDARRGEVYGAVYDLRGRLVQPECVTPFREWLARLPEEVEILSPQAELFQPMLAGTRFAHHLITPTPRALAAAIGRMAATLDLSRADPLILDANYVRRSDAEMFWKDA
ncbi:MAG: tRNA (adenosine(37)-N6)-threonylcarbamoyltransferase complex dimerization subunit type 1 TsaB [Bryobacteraceae bacterium]|nr:tRNA (adenosine(37)-N6)-threonylcarbamoyltransferase complex dimerization subunit type 1 TsaB [Bryobacteraceae bacterium]MDW8376711.1 tRNA (adenosine(37)-N6)-threonylcarbamoyltransferase complex dimerization subunit type 1 TsaB [Bryobacterales bacterium]